MTQHRRNDDVLHRRFLKPEHWAPVIVTVALAGGSGALWAGGISTDVEHHEKRIEKVEDGVDKLGRGQSTIGTEIKNLKEEYQRQREQDRVEQRRTQDVLQKIFLKLKGNGQQ